MLSLGKKETRRPTTTRRTGYRNIVHYGEEQAKWEPLLDSRNVLFHSLILKLDFMKQFDTALYKESAALKDFLDFILKVSTAKAKCGVFVGP